MIIPEDEEAYWRWLETPGMSLVEAFALYRQEIERKYDERVSEEPK